VDFGLRSLGIALSDEEGTLARPLRVLSIGSVREAPQAVAEVADTSDVDEQQVPHCKKIARACQFST